MCPAEPPSLAERLLSFATCPTDRDAVVGDLREEFADRTAADQAQATRWYWMQVMRALPSLITERWRRLPRPHFMAEALAVLLAYASIALLEHLFVSPMATTLANSLSHDRLGFLSIYLLVQPMAIVLVAAITAHVMLRRGDVPMRRVVWRLAALAGLLVVPGIALTALGSSPGWVMLRLLWSAFVVFALVAGALVGAWSSSRRQQTLCG